MNKDPKETLEGLIAGNSKKGPKNPKGSARAKFNRRRIWLAHALDQMDIAIDELLSQEGTVYKRKEVDNLKDAISSFRNATGIKSPDIEPPTQEELDHFMETLSNLKPWEPPSKEELAGLYASLGLPTDDEDEEGSGDDSGH